MKQPALQQIIQNARKGDQEAINELYYSTYKYAYYIARQHLNSESDIQDVMQEVYSSAFGKLDTIEKEMYFKTWLYKIVLNKCRNFVQRNRADYIPMDEIADLAADSEEILPAEWVDKAEKRQDIMRLIDTLPEGHRLAIILHYMNELSIPEVAEIMGITVEAVRNHLYHGRKAIKAAVLEEESKGNKLYALAPMPVLARVFELEAEATVVPEAVSQSVMQRLIENGIIKSAPTTPNAGTHTTGTEANSTSTGQQASNTGTNTVNLGSPPLNEELNTPNAGAHAANAGANAAGGSAAEKGGLIKMFLGLSTGKKVGMIAASLAVLIGLSVLASALAAPTPTPTLGGVIAEATPTPTPGIGAGPPPNPNGPSGPGGGGGTKPGDGPSGTGKPEATAPPKQDKPDGEDNTPWEVEPDSGGNPIRAKKSKIKKMTTVWTIRVSGKQDMPYPIGIRPLTHHDIKFEATKQGGNNMLGAYTGKGSYWYEVDRGSYMSLDPECTDYGCELNGPLTKIEFTLNLAESDSDELAPLIPPEEELAPLVPPEPELAPLIPAVPVIAKANGTAIWAYQWIKDFAKFKGGNNYNGGTSASDKFDYQIWVCGAGEVFLFVNAPPFPTFLLRGRISKTMKLVDVK